MAWTSPMTFVANNVLTAAQMNTHLRDNLLETAPAKATTSGGSFFVSQGPNRIEERVVKVSRANPFEEHKNNSYTNLATPGPIVRVETGETVILMMGCRIGNSIVDLRANMSFEISGDTEREPNDKFSIQSEGRIAGRYANWGVTFLVTDLNPGTNIFTAKYKCDNSSNNTGQWGHRFIGVIPL